ncbi:MAG: DUF21 domain-containing protein [Alkalinema sp. FL-bin-369]|nr:DUF21 domain-containing protein [Leptolyngbyaceae cyanobacterium LF-bin-369]
MSFPFNSLLILLLLIVSSGVFVMSELAIVSSRKVRLQQSANQGDKGARMALKLANDPNNFLAAAQIGIPSRIGCKNFEKICSPNAPETIAMSVIPI